MVLELVKCHKPVVSAGAVIVGKVRWISIVIILERELYHDLTTVCCRPSLAVLLHKH
jgi:hypothetical protein